MGAITSVGVGRSDCVESIIVSPGLSVCFHYKMCSDAGGEIAGSSI